LATQEERRRGATKRRSSPERAPRLAEYQRRRDFGKTSEPAGAASPRRARKRAGRSALEFVVQKHAASSLHFDFRLELDGVMKSWAVPKGPSTDPAVRRLAMETEDHPLEYNAFEGIIPEGEYGGGTVMIWDRGRYHADEASPGDDERVLRRDYARGKLSFTLEGERLRGSWSLIRTRGAGRKPSWLLLKHRDRYARAGADIVGAHDTSVVSGRTLEQIATGRSRVWRSKRVGAARGTSADRGIRPMLAASAQRLPASGEWRFEPSPGGTRVLAYVTPDAVRLSASSGRDYVTRHPEIARELARLAGRGRRSVVLDGEIVAPRGEDATLHVSDLLLEDDDALVELPYVERRARLAKLYARRRQQRVRLVPSHEDAAAAARAAKRSGWKGIVAKRSDSPYRAGSRGRAWLRLPLPR
jgi:bifunctional non-homologous end joining protein LigD